ncbi:hypothetical protein [Microbispora sp. ATCC PTA-5024]|uniref:hypothetical protein n=1 Tax=Microbispora sp. ATCC PTA-5024 TaxID=316330 RepID=UPI0018DBF42F|nr:hypothetical protein [Microbispora sp. ATCC PTA-5024]
MFFRHVLASLAVVPALVAPAAAAHASAAGGPGVLPQKTHFDLQVATRCTRTSGSASRT